MGEVYRARDTRLDRDVAIKILPELFAADPERIARFKREAKTLASLNHPNIGGIYGLEDTGDVNALVLELVEGPTLADRISHGPIPLDEALPIARQIAEALEAAHEQGIIHRDLKPANIKLRPDGTVKVLDFGLAKLAHPDAAAGAVDVTASPTITSPAMMTGVGVLLGTAAYMSPEQAKGREADKRSDIWAFGCVLYEMLTGRRAFHGEDVSDTLATVLKSDPDWSDLSADTPLAIRKLLRRCLEKDPRRRLPDIGSARLEIDDAQPRPTEHVVPTPKPYRSGWRRGVALTAALLVACAATGIAVWLAMRPGPSSVVRLRVTPSGTAALSIGGYPPRLAISPDGTRLVYVGAGGSRIFVRAFDQLEPTALQGLGTPGGLFFSPDGQSIGFFDGFTTLKKVATTGGPPITISRITGNPQGASWGTDETIIFSTDDPSSGLLRVAATGGQPEVLTTPDLDQGEVDHVQPEVLPGGQAVLFTILTRGNAQIAVLDLKTGEQKIVIRGGGIARYVPTGHLVYEIGPAGPLRAVAFDLRRREAARTPVPVLDQEVTTTTNMGLAHDGTLVYVPLGAQANQPRTLVWVDRQGREEALAAPPRRYLYPRLSPDGTKVALSEFDQDREIRIWDLARQTLMRFTFDPGQDNYPVWTPDGRRLIFRSPRAGPNNVYGQAADGTGAVERLTETQNEQAPYAVSPDGTRLVLREDSPKTGSDLMVLALDGAPRVTPLIQTPFDELNGEISPDGRWLAYESDESGQEEIYVRPFPDVTSGRWQISSGGGRTPLWARSGKELFYRAVDGAVLGVAVEVAGAAGFRTGTPVKLVEGRYLAGTASLSPGRIYDVSPDGQRFLMIKEGGGSDLTAAPPSIVVVQNWTEELKRLVPTKR